MTHSYAHLIVENFKNKVDTHIFHLLENLSFFTKPSKFQLSNNQYVFTNYLTSIFKKLLFQFHLSERREKNNKQENRRGKIPQNIQI